MSNRVLINLKTKYETEIAISTTNIELFLASPQGVAEHIDYAETVEKELEKIAHANDMMQAVDRVMS